VITQRDRLPEMPAQPGGSALGLIAEAERCRGGGTDGGKAEDSGIQVIARAQAVDRRSALAVDPAAASVVHRPDTVAFETPASGDLAGGKGNRVQGFDRMNADRRKVRLGG